MNFDTIATGVVPGTVTRDERECHGTTRSLSDLAAEAPPAGARHRDETTR